MMNICGAGSGSGRVATVAGLWAAVRAGEIVCDQADCERHLAGPWALRQVALERRVQRAFPWFCIVPRKLCAQARAAMLSRARGTPGALE